MTHSLLARGQKRIELRGKENANPCGQADIGPLYGIRRLHFSQRGKSRIRVNSRSLSRRFHQYTLFGLADASSLDIAVVRCQKHDKRLGQEPAD